MSTTELDNQVAAEIARLNAETLRLQTETFRLGAETARIQADTIKLQAETRMLNSEQPHVEAKTKILEQESKWFLVKVFTGAFGGALAVLATAAGFLKFLDWLRP